MERSYGVSRSLTFGERTLGITGLKSIYENHVSMCWASAAKVSNSEQLQEQLS